MNSAGGQDPVPLEQRPGVLLVGSPNVGKRTLLSRMLLVDIPDTHDLSSGVLCQGWTIDTKYYSADVSIWTAHLHEGFSIQSLPQNDQLAALVMVFDMTDEASFRTIQHWVARADISRFEILLCVGNKVDLITGHSAHAEYKRRLQKVGESFSSPNTDFYDFGINEYEGFGLLRGEEESDPCLEIRNSAVQWCIQNNIEYIEACGSNPDFDKCLSVDGDSQGVERLFGALSAHMWPGMIMKSGNKINLSLRIEKEELTDEEPDYDVEYEVLSHGSDEPWDYIGHSTTVSAIEESGSTTENVSGAVEHSDVGSMPSSSLRHDNYPETVEVDVPEIQKEETEDSDEDQSGRTSRLTQMIETESNSGHQAEHIEFSASLDAEHHSIDDIEMLMSEISNLRHNVRLMPDFQRREKAANLAMRMAAMFGNESDDE